MSLLTETGFIPSSKQTCAPVIYVTNTYTHKFQLLQVAINNILNLTFIVVRLNKMI